MMIRTPQH